MLIHLIILLLIVVILDLKVKINIDKLSVAHDMSGLGSTRSVRFMLASLGAWDAPVRSPSGCADDQIPERVRALWYERIQPVGSG